MSAPGWWSRMPARNGMTLLHAVAISAVLSACSMSTPYVRPVLDTPDHFANAGASAQAVAPARWWSQFGDPVMVELIDIALAGNRDLRIAYARQLEYQARFGYSNEARLPQIGLSAGSSRTRSGNDTFTSSYSVAAGLNWEVDLWGRVRSMSEAAYADFTGQEQARHALVLALVGAVASNYIELREYDARLEVARRTLDGRKEALRQMNLRYKMAMVGELEVTQASSEFLITELSVQQLEQAVAQKENAINFLLGRNAMQVKRGQAIAALSMPAVPAGLPSELLTRRPDIMQAEQDLVAANARVGAARAAMFPTVSLTGNFGVASTQLSGLLSKANQFLTLAPGVSLATVPLFSPGPLKAAHLVSQAQRDQALAAYQKAVLGGLRETEDALIGVTRAAEQKQTQVKLVAESRRYAYLSKLRYNNGAAGNLEVLDAQRNLYSAEQTLAQGQSAALVAMVNLYKALGGDWGVYEIAPSP